MQLGTKRDALRPLARIGLKASLWILGFIGGGAGYAAGLYFFPRNDTWQLVLAGVGIAVGVVLWVPIGNFIQRWL
ncbi:MAG: hypothetical protein PSX37_09805 [bacterium]|nr:hypothetical protein [bacterium]